MDLMQPFFDWIIAHPQWAGILIFLIAAGESLVLVGLLVPGVFFMLGIGALVGLGVLDFWSCFFWAAAGAVAGDGFSYWLGMHYHQQLQSTWPLSRYPDLVPRGERFFMKHGRKSVFLGRFIGPLRAIIPAIAGIMEMPPLHFYIVNIMSALFWAPIMLLPGIVFGGSMDAASGASTRVVIIFVVLAVIVWLIAVTLKKLIETICAAISLSSQKVYFSLSVFMVLIVGLISITVIDKKQSITEILHFDLSQQAQWWDGGWKRYPDVNPAIIVGEDRSFAVQWLANAVDVENMLLNSGWHKPVPLSYSNTFLWLDPDVGIEMQPVLPDYYYWNLPALTYAYQQKGTKQLLLLRLWADQSDVSQFDKKLWFGYVSKITPAQWMGVIFYPQETFDDADVIKQFVSLYQSGSVGEAGKLKIVQRRFEHESVNEMLLIRSQ